MSRQLISTHPGSAMLQHGESANPDGDWGRSTSTFILRSLFLLAIFLLVSPALAQPSDRVTSGSLTQVPRLFSIGYLRRESTGHPPEENLERLRSELVADAATQRELRKLGYTGIGLFACDGPTEMVRRLNTREFNLAFTPANLYRQQAAGYTPILKARRPDDIYNPTGDIVLRRGVVFVSPRCEQLFGKSDLPAPQVAQVLGSGQIAVVSAQSAAGFTAPLMELRRLYGRESLQGGVIYFDSSEEVVKAVLAGLADVGACEEQTLRKMLDRPELKARGITFDSASLFLTNPVVTDPVVVSASLSPRHSALGRILRLKIGNLSRGASAVTGSIQYIPATDEDYRKLIELFKEFDEFAVGEGR